MSKFGYHGQVLHVDLTRRAFKPETMAPEWYRTYAGGELMGAYFLLRDTKKGVDALAEESLLVFAPGIIAGYDAPGLAQFTVAARSPITREIAFAQCEGAFGRFLKACGYDAVIFRGKAKTPAALIIEDGVPRFAEAGWVWGNSALESANLFARAYGLRREAIVSLGQAGENGARFAAIVSGAGNQAAGMGVGAVMGSKNLKAVVVIGTGGVKVNDIVNTTNRIMEIMREDCMLEDREPLHWEKSWPQLVCGVEEINPTALNRTLTWDMQSMSLPLHLFT